MNWVLVGCASLLALFALIGLKQGVIKMIYHMAGFVLALVLTAFVAPIISKTLIKESSPSVEKMKEKVIKTLKLDEIRFDVTVSDDVLDKLNLPDAIRDEIKIFNTKDLYEKMEVEDAKDYLATTLATIILQAIIYVFTFLVLWLLLFIAFHALNVIDKLPVLHAANRIAGLAVGLILAACIILVFFVLVTALANFPFGRTMLDQINGNPILKFWYDNNPLNGGFVSLSSRFK